MTKLQKIQRVFLDMDGTIYRGSRLFPTTLPFLDFLTERKIGYTFLSNNSSYSIPEYVEKLRRMGLDAERSDFYTSTEYTIDHLRRSCPAVHRIHLLAMESIRRTFEEAGFDLDERNPQAVVSTGEFRASPPIRTYTAQPTGKHGSSTAEPSPELLKFRPTPESKYSVNRIPEC